jgi:biopolymer transport protein ExbD
MAGVSVDSGSKGGRRALDSELNMIPMIDLLMVTISFLLITAVWSNMTRLDANAQVPGDPSLNPAPEKAEKTLHVEMGEPDKFVLSWRDGASVLDRFEVPRKDMMHHEGTVRVVQFPDLTTRVTEAWNAGGVHRNATDTTFDRIVLHTDDRTPYAEMIGVMDALNHVQRPLKTGSKIEQVAAFRVVFSAK